MANSIPEAIMAPITGNEDVPVLTVAMTWLVIGVLLDRLVLNKHG